MAKLTKQLGFFLQETLKTAFGNNLAEMSRELGIHRNHLKRYIEGETAPNTDSLEKIAKGLKIQPAELLMSPEDRKAWQEAKPQPAIRPPDISQVREDVHKLVEHLDYGRLKTILSLYSAAEPVLAEKKKTSG